MQPTYKERMFGYRILAMASEKQGREFPVIHVLRNGRIEPYDRGEVNREVHTERVQRDTR